MKPFTPLLLSLLLCSCNAVATTGVPAAGSDPMRPAQSTASLPGINPAGAADSSNPEAAAALPQLQATRRTGQGPWLALIDGRWRAQGERHGNHLVAAVNAKGVVLETAGQRRTYTLQAAADAATTEDTPR